MVEKFLDFLSKFFDKLTDRDVRRKLFIIAGISTLAIFIVSKDVIFAYLSIVSFVSIVVDVVYDRYENWRLRSSTSGQKALKRLDQLDDECKRVIKEIYGADDQSVVLLMASGCRALLVNAGMITACSNMAYPYGVDLGLPYCLQPWVRRYIDENQEWLQTVPKGKSKAKKRGDEYMSHF